VIQDRGSPSRRYDGVLRGRRAVPPVPRRTGPPDRSAARAEHVDSFVDPGIEASRSLRRLFRAPPRRGARRNRRLRRGELAPHGDWARPLWGDRRDRARRPACGRDERRRLDANPSDLPRDRSEARDVRGGDSWTALAQFQRLWDRILDGGDCAVGRAGPKDARLEVVGLPLFRIRYFRFAFRFYTLTLCRLFATSCYVNEVPKGGGPTFGTFRVAWA